MARIPEAMNRMYKNMFVCKNCGAKIRSEPRRIIEGQVKCRRCSKRAFRTIKKK